LGSNFKVNDDAGSTIQMLPDITMHDVGHFIITWTDERGIYKRDIYAQRYDSSGTPIGSNFSVNDNAGRSWHLFPAIAMDYLGNFVITWEDYRNIGGPDIYTQRYDSSATPLDSNFKVNDDVAAEQWLPAMALDGSHNFLITWSDDRNGSNNPDIYAQRYDSSGTPLGSNFRVNDDAGTAHQYSTAIAMDVSGNFVVTWEDWRYGNHDIYAQRYNSSGTPLGSNFKVNDEPEYADQESPSIAMDGSGNFVITWDDWRNGNHDIYAQRYNSSGTPLGSNFKVNDDAGSSDQRTPATAMDGSGNFVITWNDYRNGNCDIYAQRYEPSGTPLGSNFKVNDDPGTAHQHSPAITMDGSSNFVITWEDDRNGDFDIYAQRYDSSGTSLGSNFKVNDDPGSSDQRYPAIAVDSFGNFVITWEDYRNGSNGDIYAQRYDSSGNPLHSNYLVPNSDYASFSQIRPAVTANSSNIYFTWQDDRKVTSWDIYAKVVDWIWPSFCGDVNVDGVVDIADVVYLLNYFFLFGPPPVPIEAGDVNLDGTVNGADVIYLVNYLFIGGPPPCS
jgi:hypothetical protein